MERTHTHSHTHAPPIPVPDRLACCLQRLHAMALPPFRTALLAATFAITTAGAGCVPDAPADFDGGTPVEARPGDQRLPAGTEVAPGSELEQRLEGECILFDPWGDGRDEPVCIMSTPQDGTIGRLGPETETDHDEEVGGSRSALRDRAPDVLPPRADHRSQYLDGCLSVSDQKRCGWCVDHAAVAVLEALHCSKGCDVPELSEAHLRSRHRGGAPFGSCAGGWNGREALQQLVDTPIVDNDAWPYVANGRGLNNDRPSDSVLDMASHQATGSHDVDIRDLDAIKRELASEREIIIGIPVFSARKHGTSTRTDWSREDAYIRRPDPENPCACRDESCRDAMCLDGYHALVITGYDDATGRFQFLNSWGKEWGDGGYGTMDYDYVTQYARYGAALDDIRTDLPGNACEAAPSADAGAGDAGTGDAGMDTPEDPCTHASDCATCTPLSGCAWCEGAGCQLASATCEGGAHPEVCPRTMDACAASSDCGTCVAAEGCTWCASNHSCYSTARRTASCYDPRNAADQCNDCGAASSDCGECAQLDGCGWCAGGSVGVVAPGAASAKCVVGGDDVPDRESCDSYRGTRAMCGYDECALITDCGACVDAAGCGWCDGSDQCMPGGFFGASGDPEIGSTCGSDWDWYGFACDNTEATCGDAASCRECLRSGVTCEWDDSTGRCGEPTSSGSDGVIRSELDCPGVCGGAYAPCGSDTDCCEGLGCVNGDCVECGSAGLVEQACDYTEVGACCGTLVCGQSPGGGFACCRSSGDACESSAECCGEMACVSGRCACRESGASCLEGRECCGGSFCDEGSCS